MNPLQWLKNLHSNDCGACQNDLVQQIIDRDVQIEFATASLQEAKKDYQNALDGLTKRDVIISNLEAKIKTLTELHDKSVEVFNNSYACLQSKFEVAMGVDESKYDVLTPKETNDGKKAKSIIAAPEETYESYHNDCLKRYEELRKATDSKYEDMRKAYNNAMDKTEQLEEDLLLALSALKRREQEIVEVRRNLNLFTKNLK